MKRTLLAAAAALALPAFASPASAQADVGSQVAAGLEAQGFGNIEVDNEGGVVKVEGVRGTTKVEYRYDAQTGELLEQETYRIAADDTVSNDDDHGFDDNGGDRDRGSDDDDGFDDKGGDRGDGDKDDRSDDDDDDDSVGDDDDNGGRGRGRGRGRGGDNDGDDD